LLKKELWIERRNPETLLPLKLVMFPMNKLIAHIAHKNVKKEMSEGTDSMVDSRSFPFRISKA
jgi:hypothetical protein